MEHDNDPSLSTAPYTYYPHEDGQYAGVPYTQPHLPYQVVSNPSAPEMLQMRGLSLMSHQAYAPQGAVYPGPSPGMGPVSPTRVAASMQLPPSPSPADAAAASFEHPISPPISGSDTSNDGHPHYHPPYSRESSSGAGSPPANYRNNSLVHRSQHRYHPAPPPPLKTRRRRSSTNDDNEFSDDGEHDGGPMGISPQSTGSGMSSQHLAESLANSRKEATRRQRIEAEQRRRDELREGYSRLKNVLPVSNQKSSKVSLLERATNYIVNLDQASKIVHARVAALEAEVAHLREINERLSLTVAQHTGHMPTELELGIHPHPPPPPEQQQLVDPSLERPLSPPPDIQPPPVVVPSSHPHPHPHAPQPQPAQQPHEQLFHAAHARTDSSASGSHASGSEY